MVSIPGGEPLLHKEIGEIVAELVKRKRFVYLCTNALLLEKKLAPLRAQPLPHLLDPPGRPGGGARPGGRPEGRLQARDQGDQGGQGQGLPGQRQLHAVQQRRAREVAEFFDFVTGLGVEGITVSPGYAYERAPDQEHFLTRQHTKNLFRDVFRRGKGKNWQFSQSTLFLDFLAGNQTYQLHALEQPDAQHLRLAAALLPAERGLCRLFTELMEETDWDGYGTGNYEKCANCMVHCGYEATAVTDTLNNPLKAWKLSRKGIDTEAPMAPEITLDKQRPAEFVFDALVREAVDEIHAPAAEPSERQPEARAKADSAA